MSTLTNPFDDAAAAAERAAQPDPLVMYLVVRRERVTDIVSLLRAAAQATVLCDRTFRTAPAWSAHSAAWHAGSFRKVTLRANEKDWPKLRAEFEHVVDPGSEPLVAVLPPRPRSQAGPFLSRLQAYTTPLSDLTAGRNALIADYPTMLIAPNPFIPMSAGKLVAQVGHAALMAADAARDRGADATWADAAAAWERRGMAVGILTPDYEHWVRALGILPCIVVTDHGLTEVTPGSQTVLATRPSRAEELTASLRIFGR